VELRQLEYFVAVARELHFGRAAEKLHVAQPSISQQIKALEGELGVQLFERTSKAVSLTGPGAELFPLAAKLLDDAAHLRRLAQISARRLTGEVRIGFLADEYAQGVGERFLTAIRREHPRLVLEFEQLDFAEHHRALERGIVDLAFVVSPPPDDVVSVPLFEWPRLVAVSSRLAESRPDDLESLLAQQPVALPNAMASQAWRMSWLPTLPNPGATFVVGEDSMEAMLAVVGAGRAIAVVPEYVARFYPQPGVQFVTTPAVGPCTVGVGALRSRQGELQIGTLLKLAASVAPRGGWCGPRGASRQKPTGRGSGGAGPPSVDRPLA
jgi:DNA-binding transcriptional LysR family regulator